MVIDEVMRLVKSWKYFELIGFCSLSNIGEERSQIDTMIFFFFLLKPLKGDEEDSRKNKYLLDNPDISCRHNKFEICN